MSAKRQPLPGAIRQAVFERDAYRCVACQSWASLHIDHIQPVSKGGTNDLDNLQTMCASCNLSKGARWEGPFETDDTFFLDADGFPLERRFPRKETPWIEAWMQRVEAD